MYRARRRYGDNVDRVMGASTRAAEEACWCILGNAELRRIWSQANRTSGRVWVEGGGVEIYALQGLFVGPVTLVLGYLRVRHYTLDVKVICIILLPTLAALGGPRHFGLPDPILVPH